MEVSKIYASIDQAKKSLIAALERINTAISDAQAIGGAVAQIVPTNLEKSAETILNIIEGQDQSSLNNLVNALDEIPLKSILAKDRVSQTEINRDAFAGRGGGINTMPQGGAPQSSIMASRGGNEGGASSILESNEDPLKSMFKNYKSKVKMQEREGLSFDAILDDDEIGAFEQEDWLGDVASNMPLPTDFISKEAEVGGSVEPDLMPPVEVASLENWKSMVNPSDRAEEDFMNLSRNWDGQLA